MPAYRALPAQLTTPLPEPTPPPVRCTDHDQAAVCVVDALGWIEDWRALLRRANADRATAARIGNTATATGKP